LRPRSAASVSAARAAFCGTILWRDRKNAAFVIAERDKAAQREGAAERMLHRWAAKKKAELRLRECRQQAEKAAKAA